MDPYTTLGRFREMSMESQPQKGDGRRRLPPPSSLYMSPPEEDLMHSFSEHTSPAPTKHAWDYRLAPIQSRPSPPPSPESRPLPRLPALMTELSQHSAASDLPLFPHARSDSESQSPLFDRRASNASETRQDSLSPEEKRAGKKSVNEMSIFASFKTSRDLREYYRANLEDLQRIGGFAKPCEPRMTPIINKSMDDYISGVKRSFHRTGAGVSKPRRSIVKPAVEKIVRVPKQIVTPVAVRKVQRAPTIPRENKSQSVEPAARKRAPPTKHAPLKSDDKNWAQLPDYCPPLDTLDSKPKVLKVTWRGSPNDLSGDPDAWTMHPQEIEAAAELKLPAAQYMANKRRIFQSKLASLKDGRVFTKTAAQQACNVDVNKTSKLFEAFARAGWFEKEHFEKWL
nr:hypothetical protein B0A51_09699 [Rachicladosporium sp. CCFEE 5018]